MPKFQVEVMWQQVEVQRAIVEVEAEDKFKASDLAYDLVSAPEYAGDWDELGIIGGNYIVNTVEEIE